MSKTEERRCATLRVESSMAGVIGSGRGRNIKRGREREREDIIEGLDNVVADELGEKRRSC